MNFMTKDYKTVRVNFKHLKQHMSVRPHLIDALIKVDTQDQDFVHVAVDFGRPIGRSGCVTTTDADEIVYAKRKGRPIYSRFAKGRIGEPCSLVTVVMVKKGNLYQLLTAYIGYPAEREPGDSSIHTRAEYEASVAFWNHHALTLHGVDLASELTTDGKLYYAR